MTEAELQQLLTEALDLGGWRWVHFRPARTEHGWRTAMSGSVGWPDLFAVRGGVALAIEVKSQRGTVHAEQHAWLDLLGEVPGITRLVVRPDTVDDLLPVLISKPQQIGR